ncbi:unnamed protein product [Acanthoscelides obtectus]|uniref:Uncharacterized protein n=1 Tax=Acanthoscelides obtectus TaxID=200917 RepID=A0A9P0QIY8_ACAOB|nr:unnamed protein product [Acanthoscelides obtectus]CAK1627311.1 hypothetical protein AOBTE_LOCUS4506 [Acanthoscelides obtectus]
MEEEIPEGRTSELSDNPCLSNRAIFLVGYVLFDGGSPRVVRIFKTMLLKYC